MGNHKKICQHFNRYSLLFTDVSENFYTIITLYFMAMLKLFLTLQSSPTCTYTPIRCVTSPKKASNLFGLNLKKEQHLGKVMSVKSTLNSAHMQ